MESMPIEAALMLVLMAASYFLVNAWIYGKISSITFRSAKPSMLMFVRTEWSGYDDVTGTGVVGSRTSAMRLASSAGLFFV